MNNTPEIYLLCRCIERQYAEMLFDDGILHFNYPKRWIDEAKKGNVGQGDELEGVYSNEVNFKNLQLRECSRAVQDKNGKWYLRSNSVVKNWPCVCFYCASEKSTDTDEGDTRVIDMSKKIAKEKDTKGEYRRVGEIHGFTILMCSEPLDKDGLGMFQNKFCVEGNFKYKYNNGFIALSDPIAAARNFINSLERIPQTIEQYKEKNAALAKDIPLLQEIANKQWKKEDELKGLKSELAALDRKIQLELAKDDEPAQQVANGTDGKENAQIKEASSKETKSSGLHI